MSYCYICGAKVQRTLNVTRRTRSFARSLSGRPGLVVVILESMACHDLGRKLLLTLFKLLICTENPKV